MLIELSGNHRSSSTHTFSSLIHLQSTLHIHRSIQSDNWSSVAITVGFQFDHKGEYRRFVRVVNDCSDEWISHEFDFLVLDLDESLTCFGLSEFCGGTENYIGCEMVVNDGEVAVVVGGTVAKMLSRSILRSVFVRLCPVIKGEATVVDGCMAEEIRRLSRRKQRLWMYWLALRVDFSGIFNGVGVFPGNLTSGNGKNTLFKGRV
ncbi:hypothetical protein L1987_08540 [Smallanthus sonchifolius]|uniref:Uncharacterized protein n=1 Tax=Smallanthus sonchifolius TaxID=185202 RepID=A0ACB9JLF2_9ASTR|nr:hypothetical protein L1987_08540 [Smallanthus sonchifolius]